MGTWVWLNMPLAILILCCWAGIPLWLTVTRWHAELEAKNAEVRAGTDPVPVPVLAQQAPGRAAVYGTAS